MKTLHYFQKIALGIVLFLAFSANSLFAQSVITQNVTGPGVCDGAAFVDSSVYATNIVWSNNSNVIQQGGNYIGNLCSGTYVITFSDGQGNTITETFNIGTSAPDPCSGFVVSYSSTPVSGTALCDGSGTVSASGGTSPYSFAWSNNEVTSTINNLCVGYYSCQISDANGCQTSGAIWVGGDSTTSVDSSLVIVNDTYPSGDIIDTLGTQTWEDCNLDVMNIAGASVTSIIDTLNGAILTWEVLDSNGVALGTYTVFYPTNIDSTGVYQVTFVLYCYGKTINTYELTIVDQVLLTGLSAVNENTLNSIKYNNPINDELAIQFPTNADYTVSIHDLSGKSVFHSNFNSTSKAVISTQELNSGAYILTISTKNEQISVKLVK